MFGFHSFASIEEGQPWISDDLSREPQAPARARPPGADQSIGVAARSHELP